MAGNGTALGAPLVLILLVSTIDAMISSVLPRRISQPGLQRLVTSMSFTYYQHWRSRRRASVACFSYHQTSTLSSSSSSAWTAIDWADKAYADNEDKYDGPYDVADYSDLLPTPSPQQPSPVERILVRDRLVYVKRDDLLRLSKSNVSGNKARKFLSLNELAAEDFPNVVVSYGGPQSNAMVALAAIVHSKSVLDNDIDEDNETTEKKRFIYYTKKLPRWLRQQPSGNFLRAQSLGMELVELPHRRYDELFGGESGGSATPPPELDPPILAADDVESKEERRNKPLSCLWVPQGGACELDPPILAADDVESKEERRNKPLSCLWVPQGGACGVASRGTRVQAEEIVGFWLRNGKGLPLAVCLPGGTCTTALLLHRAFKDILHNRRQNHESPLDIQVVVIPCVGGDEYAQRQMSSLDEAVGGDGKDLPAILKPIQSDVEKEKKKGNPKRPNRKGYFRFGEPDAAILATYNELKEKYGLFVDLLYGGPAWTILLQHWSDETAHHSHDNESPINGRQIMYVHSGGLEGISSQLTRYKHKGLVDPTTIQ